MYQTEIYNIAISLLVTLVIPISVYYTNKSFQERFKRYKEQLDQKITENAKRRLKTINTKIDQRGNIDEIIKLSKKLAEELDRYEDPIREYEYAYSNIKYAYASFFASIFFSLLAIKYPSLKIGELTPSGVGFFALLLGITLITAITIRLQMLSEKALESELKKL